MKKWKKLAAAAVIGTAALAALSLGGCAKKEQGTIKIASKPMTESSCDRSVFPRAASQTDTLPVACGGIFDLRLRVVRSSI